MFDQVRIHARTHTPRLTGKVLMLHTSAFFSGWYLAYPWLLCQSGRNNQRKEDFKDSFKCVHEKGKGHYCAALGKFQSCS